MTQPPQETAPPSLVGRVLNERYRLDVVVGRGGMATVYQATDLRLGREIAVKALDPAFQSDDGAVKRFQREAEFAAGLSAHPNIVSVYDVGADCDLHYLVMEYVPGANLKTVIGCDAPIRLDRATHIAGEVAAALDFAHRHGFIHRDIKPQNILVGQDGGIKVTDFGIARSLDANQLTKTGVVFGTACYLAPEQARGREVVAQSDVYALGVVIFEMLTGHPPFEADTSIGVAMQHLTDAVPAPSTQNPTLPEWIDRVVLRALEKDPKRRFATARAFREALNNKDESREITRPQPVISKRVPPIGKSRIPANLMVFAILLVAFVSVGGAYGAFQGLSNSGVFTDKPKPIVYTAGSGHSHHPNSKPQPTATPVPTPDPNQAAAVEGLVHLTSIWVSTESVAPGGSIALTYDISNSSAGSVPIGLYAQLATSDNQLNDAKDNVVSTIAPGSQSYQRTFIVPRTASPGSYSLIVKIQNPSMTTTYGQIEQPNPTNPAFHVTVSGPATT